jgi:hypothetical protein
MAARKKKGARAHRSELPFLKNDGGRSIVWWNVIPTGKWVQDFRVGRQYAMEFWKVCGPSRSFALEFQQVILGMLTVAKSPKGPTSYSGIEAGFLLAVGELSGGVAHIQQLLQNNDTRARWTRVVDEIPARHYTPDHWEFGDSRSP